MATSVIQPDVPLAAESAAPPVPAHQGWKERLRRVRHGSAWSTVAVSLTLAVIATVSLRAAHVWGSRPTASMLAISPQPTVDCVIESGATVTRLFTVTNTSSSSVMLIGSQQSCGCVVSDGLPTELRPGKCAVVSSHLSASGLVAGKAVDRTSFLLTNIDGLTPRFDFHLSAKASSPLR